MALGAGEVFAGYTIVRQLGSGGMGEVYLAQHPRLPRREALKILRVEISNDESFRQRFIREADSIAALEHPNIVTVYDRGDTGGRLWIATQFVDGLDAAQLLRNRYPAGMPVEEALAIATAIAKALDYAHDRGLVHRDVKPANILLSQRNHDGDRRIFLADFGIARPVDDPAGLTATNFTLGTFAYAAPEQLMGKAIDGRADQYALAATVYHLLTGTPVFSDSNQIAVISQHLTQQPPAPSAIRAELAPFDTAFTRSLAKNPNTRYPNCTAFAQALTHTIHQTASLPPNAPTQQAAIPPPGLKASPPKTAPKPGPARSLRDVFIELLHALTGGRWPRTAIPIAPPNSGTHSRGFFWALAAIALTGVAVAALAVKSGNGSPPTSTESAITSAASSALPSNSAPTPAPPTMPVAQTASLGRRVDNATGGFSFLLPAGWEVADASRLSYGQALLLKEAGPAVSGLPAPWVGVGGLSNTNSSILLGRMDSNLFAGAEQDASKAAVRLASDMGEFFMPFPGSRVDQRTRPLQDGMMPGAAASYDVKFSDPTKPNGQIWAAVVGTPAPSTSGSKSDKRWYLVYLGTAEDPIATVTATALAQSIQPYTPPPPGAPTPQYSTADALGQWCSDHNAVGTGPDGTLYYCARLERTDGYQWSLTPEAIPWTEDRAGPNGGAAVGARSYPIPRPIPDGLPGPYAGDSCGQLHGTTQDALGQVMWCNPLMTGDYSLHWMYGGPS